MKKIVFDMDNTLADLYGVKGWREALEASDSMPYRKAEPMFDMDYLATLLNAAADMGYSIEVVSWLCRGGSREYDGRVRSAKLYWLKKNINFEFSAVHIVKYGTPKSTFCDTADDILFDDTEEVRSEWRGVAYEPADIFTILEDIVG